MKALSAVALLCLIAAFALGGTAPFARLAFLLGLPGLAARVSDDPSVAGVGWYLAGDYPKGDDAFRRAGRNSTYNRGLSLASVGAYPLSVAYFRAVLFVNPSDSQARENMAYVSTLYPPVVGEANNAGRIKAEAYKTHGGAVVEGVRRLERPLDEGGRVADAAWLAALADDPGEFLRLRLAEEHMRRLSLGLTPPEEGDPW
ncbi:hypothetical protein [Falsigemmobacter faecalis]|uniref:Tetratricopeptide repeat protein n=1 Tax=Falsigemmobacter faecalis TaxID=2488730 RepID=A0A3P3DDC2_9RHOB|nr:hypothetical protein [Falsigemmobacter faecalis]RRH72327.1 hypothetical protein EG244_15220 [Falsigemmobacter faecalis]